MSQEFDCPACGAPLVLESRYSTTAVCKYCGQTSHISAGTLTLGKKAALLTAARSIFKVGASGDIAGREFKVLGRIRYAYEDGVWDEWYLEYADGAAVWLQEDEGAFTAFQKAPITFEVPPFEKLRVGTNVLLGDKKFFITEKSEAAVQGAEGELRFRVEPGSRICYADGSSAGQLASLEYTPDEIELCIGQAVPVESVRIR